MRAKLLVGMPEFALAQRALDDAQTNVEIHAAIDIALAQLADKLGISSIEFCVVPNLVNEVWLVNHSDGDITVEQDLEWP